MKLYTETDGSGIEVEITMGTKVDSKIGSVCAKEGDWIISEFSKEEYMLEGLSFGVTQGNEMINIPGKLSKKSPGLYVFSGTEFIIRGHNFLETKLSADKSQNPSPYWSTG